MDIPLWMYALKLVKSCLRLRFFLPLPSVFSSLPLSFVGSSCCAPSLVEAGVFSEAEFELSVEADGPSSDSESLESGSSRWMGRVC